MNTGTFCFGLLIGVIIVLAVLAITRSRSGSGSNQSYPAAQTPPPDMNKRAVGFDPHDASPKLAEKELKPDKIWASDASDSGTIVSQPDAKPGKIGFGASDRDDDSEKRGKLGSAGAVPGGKFSADRDEVAGEFAPKGGKFSASAAADDDDDDDAKRGKLGGKGGKLG